MTGAHELDEAFLALVRAWSREDSAGGKACDEPTFDRHARALFAYQIEHNQPYGRFAAACGFTRDHLPASWREIPAVPASAFKDATLATFDVRNAELIFHTSGTTTAQTGRHFLERAALYDAALLAGFDRFMALACGPRGSLGKLRFLTLVPDPRSNKHSSLGYMIGHVSVLRGDGKAKWFLNQEQRNDAEARLDVAGFTRAMHAAIADAQEVCIAATAFALVALLDALEERDQSFAAPPRSRILETGGFKGRSRSVSRDDLYAHLTHRLGIPHNAIIAEYGMTELTSQYYDAPASRERGPRIKVAPPWLRTLVVTADGRELPPGEIGFLRHFDLGNRSSVLAVQTEDRGYAAQDGIVLLGRELDAPPRGCSLDAEDLVGARSAKSS